MICRKRDMIVDDQQIPCWQLRQMCGCGRLFGATVTLPLELFDHARISWRAVAARRLLTARAAIREHIRLDTGAKVAA